MVDRITVVLSKNRKSGTHEELLEEKLLRALASRRGVEPILIPHLYDLAPDGPAFERLRAVAGDLVVFSWLYPRAAFWVLDANGIKGRLGSASFLVPGDLEEPPSRPAQSPQRTMWCLDLRTHNRPEPFLEQIERIATLTVEPPPESVRVDVGWPPPQVLEAARARWYPVVDFGRCTNCLECLNFCLFGVYGLGPGNSILIEQPDACRPGCPACSRICPQGAIMFPQHADPAIAGDSNVSLQGRKLDLSQLLRGVDPAQLAAVERLRALKEQQAKAAPGPPSHDPATEKDEPQKEDTQKDDLDRLVDEVDRLEL